MLAPADLPPVPELAGPWIQLCGRPALERWHAPNVEPVDFTVFRADDGVWQLIACVRNTTHPGAGRLLYRWTSPRLDAPDWEGAGIFLESREDWGHARGRLQAPFHVHDGERHHLFYNSNGAHALTGPDGITWEHRRPDVVFTMGRDLCILDDRARHGRWIAYYTSHEPGRDPATGDHTVRARTAPTLSGPWSEPVHDLPPLNPPEPGYRFVNAESPLVVEREGWYYRFEHMIVHASRDPLRWETPAITVLTPGAPIEHLAPEIVLHDGGWWIAAYQWRNDAPRGVFLAPLRWRAD